MISVLIPVRNAGTTLEAALESLHRQTHAPSECVVIDDGSTDSTPQQLERWRVRWPRLLVHRTGGVGIAKALNLGLGHCNQPWIARMDSDDRCHPGRFEKQLSYATSDANLALISSRVSHWVPDGAENFEGMARHIDWANSLLRHDELEFAHWIDSALPHPTWLVHRRAFDRVGLYSETPDIPEDYEWLHRFFERAKELHFLRAGKPDSEPLLDWRDSPARLTRTAPAYAEAAFNQVKTDALAQRLRSEKTSRETFVFGLGPKSKMMLKTLSIPIRAIVDVHPGRQGISYRGIEVWDVRRWQDHVSRNIANPLVLNCVGTPEARRDCERLCRENGLIPGDSFVSL